MFCVSKVPIIYCTNDRKEFRTKIMEQRKQSLGKLGKKATKFVKTEIEQTRSIIQDHVQFFRRNKKNNNSKKINDDDIEVLDAEFFEK